jgi:hypothetical protein
MKTLERGDLEARLARIELALKARRTDESAFNPSEEV